MTWVKLDDQFPHHPRVVQAGDTAAWLYVAGLCYAGQFLTDGVVPKAQIRRLTNLRRPEVEALRLVEVGLWADKGDRYEIHDYHQYNPPAEKVKAKREADRVRKESARNPDGHPQGIAAESRGRSTPTPTPTPKSLTSPSDLSNPATNGRQETTSSSTQDLVERLLGVCTASGPPVALEAERVIAQCRQYVDDKLIDEAIGYCSTLAGPARPSMPRYLITTLNDWAPKRGLQGVIIPKLQARAS